MPEFGAAAHNFAWHERFTWKDRASVTRRESLARLLKFNLPNGAMRSAAIGVLALANFAVSYWYLFRGTGRGPSYK